jgi:plastocyanin
MSTIIVISRQGSSVQFAPSPASIPVNTSVVFRNDDAGAAHQPVPAGQTNPNFWFTHPLAAFVPGRPADTSDEVLFTTKGDVEYVCALHAGEGGTIIVQ